MHGRVTEHHRFLLKLHLTQVDALTAAVQQVEQQADEVLGPFREATDRLTTMPGVSETVARVISLNDGWNTFTNRRAAEYRRASASAPGRTCPNEARTT